MHPKRSASGSTDHMNPFSRLDTTQKILIVGFVILALGEAYLFVHGQGKLTPGAPFVPTSQVGTTSQMAAPDSALSIIDGKITSIGNDSFQIVPLSAQGPQTGAPPETVVIASTTQIVAQGAPKSQAQIASDMEQFKQHSEQLMQDPQTNEDALAHLIAPAPYQETKLGASDLSVGELVSIFYDSESATGISAYQITVLPVSVASTTTGSPQSDESVH